MASTDLARRTWPLDPRVQKRPVSELLAPDLLDLYTALGTVGTIGDTGETALAVAFADDLQNDRKRLFVLLKEGHQGHQGQGERGRWGRLS
ncbi:hypothetical protein [Deinococcus sp.]|uniref:hypothetical protein n=1 Tax=Deinococcus sp. TaxID=47478 RepID=UPI003C7B3357